MRMAAFALALGACAPLLDDSDMVRLERPAAASACAARLAGVPERPSPPVIFEARHFYVRGQPVRGAYYPWRHMIRVTRDHRLGETLVHEYLHFYGANEDEVRWFLRDLPRVCGRH